MKQALEMQREYSKKPFYQYFNLDNDEIFLNYLVNKKHCVIDKNAQILTKKGCP